GVCRTAHEVDAGDERLREAVAAGGSRSSHGSCLLIPVPELGRGTALRQVGKTRGYPAGRATKTAAPAKQGRGERKIIDRIGSGSGCCCPRVDQKSLVPATVVRPDASTLVTPSMSPAISTARSICAWL